MSDIFVKAASSGGYGTTGWRKASRIWAKTANSPSTGWREATGVWIRNATQWLRVWPLSGIFATRVPYIGYFSSDTYANRMPNGTYPTIRIGDSYFGDNAQWDLNSWTASSYTYRWKLYDQYGSDLSIILRSGTGSGWTSTVGEDQLPTSIWTSTNSTNSDNQFLGFEVTANNSSNSQYNGLSVSTKIKVLRERPVNLTKTLSTNSPSIGTAITYSSTWATGEAYKAESARTSIRWYNNSTSSTSGGTSATGTGSTTATYTPNANDSGKYLYAVETRYNSGTDYDLGIATGVEASVVTSSAVTAALAAPTISSITVSTIGGSVSASFTGGSGPFYQIFWWGTATAPTGLTTPDGSGSSSPLTDSTGPTSTSDQYMYVRSTTTQSYTGIDTALASPWSAGVKFNMNSASALTPTFGTNTSTANGFTGSVTNYNSAYNWNTPSNGSFTLTNGTWTWGTASGSTRPFTVTGLSASQSSTATVTTTRTDYASGSANTTGTASALPQYTVTWSANGGTGGGSTGPFNAGTAHTAPSPGTKAGYTFNGYYDAPTGDYIYGPIASGGSFTPTANTNMTARWSVNPITPTITMAANSGVSATAGTINWTSTNQASFSSTGTFSGTGTTATSISKTGLTAGTNYTGTVTVTSSTGHTASANYSLTTSAGFVTPTAGPPQISSNQLGFVRSGTSVTWYSDYPSVSGNVSYIIGMEWQIRTTNSTTTTPLNTGTYAGGGSGDGLQGNTTKYMTYPVNTAYPYSAAGSIWAFRIRSTENTAATSSARYARARVIMMGTNGTVYFGTWSTNI